ncbi:MAG: hypothetical protein QM811_29645 [Pirellulales bacterium]
MLVLACATGCAASSTPRKNLAVLSPGVSRDAVRAELGRPLTVVDENGRATEIYGFYQGYGGLDRYFKRGLDGGELAIPHETDIEIEAEPFREKKPKDESLVRDYERRKFEYEHAEWQRVSALNSANAEAIAAQKKRRAEAPRKAAEERDKRLVALGYGHIPGYPDLLIANPYDRPGSAGVVVSRWLTTRNRRSSSSTSRMVDR